MVVVIYRYAVKAEREVVATWPQLPPLPPASAAFIRHPKTNERWTPKRPAHAQRGIESIPEK